MNKLKLAGLNLDQVFNFRHWRSFAPCTNLITAKLPNLEWENLAQTTFRSSPVSC